MTATMTECTFQELCALWRIRDPGAIVRVQQTACRNNIHYAIVERDGTRAERREWLAQHLFRCLRDYPDRVYLVYCRKQEETSITAETLCEVLSLRSIAPGQDATDWQSCIVQSYHKDVRETTKQAIQQAISPLTPHRHVRVVFATAALGCGVDVRVTDVIHDGPPATLAEVMQESGRAGREGAPSRSLLLWCTRELRHCDEETRLYCAGLGCRRRAIRLAFNDAAPAVGLPQCCDVCTPLLETPQAEPDDEWVPFVIDPFDDVARNARAYVRNVLRTYLRSISTGSLFVTSADAVTGLYPDVIEQIVFFSSGECDEDALVRAGVSASHAPGVLHVMGLSMREG